MERYLRYPEQKGGLIELADGRLMGIIRGLLKFYSEDRGRTYSEPEPLLADGEQIIGFGDPGGVLRLRSGAIGITYLGPLEPEDFPGFGRPFSSVKEPLFNQGDAKSVAVPD